MILDKSDNKEISSEAVLQKQSAISVVMITYNHADYLAESLDSIICQQTNFDFEVIVAEDLSTDNTREICFAYQKKYPDRIRVLYGENNLGPARNFYRALQAARGKYIALCEGDDQWQDISKLQIQHDFLEANPDTVVSYHDAITINERGEKIADSQLQSKKGKYDFTSYELQLGMYLPTLTMCYRNVLSEFPEEMFRVMNLDTFLISLLGGHGDARYLDNIQPAKYRVHEGGVWSSLNQRHKSIQHMTTNFWLSSYHERVGNARVASKYAGLLLERLLSDLKLTNTEFFRVSVKWLFAPSYRLYRYLRYRDKM